jgi:Ala-tRNA(Pro) deacylase
MSIAPSVARYLDQKVVYDTVMHEPTASAMRTAEACHVSGDALAKAVVLRIDGGYMLALLPASHRISLDALRAQCGVDIALAAEDEIGRLFDDCEPGAVPALGQCYGLDVVVDESLKAQPDIYFEGGDHVTLVHLAQPQFARITADARHNRFSSHR